MWATKSFDFNIYSSCLAGYYKTIFFFFFKRGSCHIVQAGLKSGMQTRLASASNFFCLCLQSARTAGMCHLHNREKLS
jgi:hypothetical protein